ncbi:MAG: outer membrane beta-barrel protein [Kiritimatiellae bacterium]|nr:outer membrane beta-barrel protein [Kiritimatiellia bacterium]
MKNPLQPTCAPFGLVGILVLGWLAPACLAEQPWEVGLHADHLLGGNLEHERGIGLGAQVIYQAHYSYSLELAFSKAGVETDLSALVLTARLHPAPASEFFDPYGGLGVGGYTFNTKSEGADENVVRFNVGLGFACRVSRQWRWFVDYRYTFLNPIVPDELDHGLLRAGFSWEL